MALEIYWQHQLLEEVFFIAPSEVGRVAPSSTDWWVGISRTCCYLVQAGTLRQEDMETTWSDSKHHSAVLQCNLLFYWRAYDQILHTLSQEFGTSTRTMVSLITTKSFSSWRSGIPKPFRDKVPTLENISMTSCTSSSSDFFWWPTIRVSTTAKAYTKMNKKMRTWIESGSHSEKSVCLSQITLTFTKWLEVTCDFSGECLWKSSLYSWSKFRFVSCNGRGKATAEPEIDWYIACWNANHRPELWLENKERGTQKSPCKASMIPKVNSRNDGIMLRTRRKRTSQIIRENGNISPCSGMLA